MRYMLKRKLFSLGNSSVIQDGEGADVFRVKGEVFTLGRKLSFQDLQGTELARIRQKLLSWRPTYEILRAGRQAALVKAALFPLMRNRFTINLPGAIAMDVRGDILNHEFAIRRDSRLVATISRRWLTLGDTYGVEIEESEDEVLVLACAVIIDLVVHQSRGE